MDTQPDREHLAKLDAHINRLGIAADFRSNLISIASRLHYERTRETCMPAIDQLDAELDAIMRVIDGREPHVPRNIDEHLDHAEDLHRRMLDIFEAAVDRLANARPGGAS
jgi:hypothetical protein